MGIFFTVVLVVSILLSLVFFAAIVVLANVSFYRGNKYASIIKYSIGLPLNIVSAYLFFLVSKEIFFVLTHETTLKALITI